MKPRTKRFFRWLGILTGALLLLLILFLVEEHVRGRIQLKRYFAQMRAHGEKLTIKELTPAPVPSDQNGAGRFLAAGFVAGRVVPENLPSSMRYAAPGAVVAMAHRPAWAIRKKLETMLDTNGVTALWRTNTGADTPRIRGAHVPMLITKEDLAADVGALSNSLAQVRAALEYPVFDFGVNYAAGFTMLLPHLTRTKSPANWLRAASLSALYETNLAASLDNLLAIAALSGVTTNEPLLISQLVRIAVFQIGVNATWEALQVDGWTDEQLFRLQTAYGNFEVLRSMTRALEMERAMGADTIDRVDSDAVAFVNNTGLLDTDIDIMIPRLPESYEDAVAPLESLIRNIVPAFNRFVYVPIWSFAWKDQDKLRLLDHWQGVIDVARMQASYPGRAWATDNSPDSFSEWFRGSDELQERPQGFYDRARYLLSSLLTGVGQSALRRVAAAHATRELLVTDLALRRFELAHGRQPDSLSELAPKFLAAAPIDPWDGMPLRYRRQSDGSSVLYSVGEDGRDDGGDGSSGKTGTRANFVSGRDLVWPRAATPAELQQFIEAEAARSRSSTTP